MLSLRFFFLLFIFIFFPLYTCLTAFKLKVVDVSRLNSFIYYFQLIKICLNTDYGATYIYMYIESNRKIYLHFRHSGISLMRKCIYPTNSIKFIFHSPSTFIYVHSSFCVNLLRGFNFKIILKYKNTKKK